MSVGGSVLLKGVRDFPEFFEKSIDKQKIDAILNSAVRFLDESEAVRYPGRKVSVLNGESRYKELEWIHRERHVHMMYVLGTVRGILVLSGGWSLKSVE